MKKILVMTLLITAFSLFGIAEDIVFANSNFVQMKISGEQEAETIQKTFAFASENINIKINSMTTEIVDGNNRVLSTSKEIDTSRVSLTRSFVMRELQAFTINIDMQKTEEGVKNVIKDIDFEVSAQGSYNIPEKISEAYLPVYKEVVDNFETSYLADREISQPNMLIVCYEGAITYMADYISWKRAKGMIVDVQTIETIGSDYTTIKEYLANYYNEHHPDYVELIGDVNGTYAIPATYIVSPTSGEMAVSDNGYALVEGDDYFPEFLIGRISVAGPMEMVTILNKTVNYERNPTSENNEWMKKALLVAGNYTDSGAHPLTPVWTSIWLRDKMLDHGYTNVDTVFSLSGSQEGATIIQNSINSGVQYIGYRGWGDANGWHYPYFHIPELQVTNSYAMNPVVASIVCNTGDYANTTVNPCFGEKWLRMGTPNNPNGCVAFFGPSDLHTHTNYNNAIYAGFFSGILDEGIRSFGAAVLRGKFEVYNNFPAETAVGANVEFWYYIYNILGDPSLNLWKLQPAQITCDLPASVNQSTSFIEVDLPNLEGATVSATKDGVNYTYTKITDGNGIVEIDPEQSGDITITITRNNRVPFIQTISVTEASGIGMTGYSIDGDIIISADDVTLNVSLKNYSATAATNVTATLSSDSEYFIAPQNPTEIGEIAAGATQSSSFQFSFDSEIDNTQVVDLNIELSTGEVIKIEVPVNGIDFYVQSLLSSNANYLPLGTNSQVDVEIVNSGYASATGLSAEIISLNSAVTVTTSNIDFTDVDPNGVSTSFFNIDVEDDAYIGSAVRFRLNFEDAAGRTNFCYYDIPIGEVDNTSVTVAGYDNYQYFAYDNFDTDYAECPTYEWLEIDPQDGGDGNVIIVGDDDVNTIDLPFTFKYFGVDYNQITICSNGWISFGEAWMATFKNWNIPSPLGSNALVAVFWDDLKGLDLGDDEYADMRNIYKYDEANNRFIIEWNDTYNQQDCTTLEKFEVILTPVADDDGDIEMRYHTVSDIDYDGKFSTVGIENHAQDDGLLYLFADSYPASATPLQDGLAIKFTKTRPDNYVDNNSDDVEPLHMSLQQNYPNPFNPVTTISYDVNLTGNVTLNIYNIKGQKVKALVNDVKVPGNYSIKWNGIDDNGNKVSSGMYLYKLETKDYSSTKKMIMMK